jgi:peptidyl-prolyl cis-trans isomerase SurA
MPVKAPSHDTTLAKIETPVSPEKPTRDENVLPTEMTDESAASMIALVDDPGQPAAEVAAYVGDTFISTREVKLALSERVRGNEAWAKLPPEQKMMIARDVLEHLVNRAAVAQAARRELKKPKQWESLKEQIERMWQESELPTYLKRYQVQNEVELAHKLAEAGESLDDLKQSYHLDQITRTYTYEKIRSKLTQPGLQEIYPYYRANIAKFQRAAENRWREIYLSIEPGHDRAAALVEAQRAHQRVSSGEDFATVAREMSRGAKAGEDGLWVLSPGAFGSKAVNEALERLEPGQFSQILEDPKGYYIVRLESRRPAGAIPFDDPQLQEKIGQELMQVEYEKILDEFLADVRKRTAVRSRLLDSMPRQ